MDKTRVIFGNQIDKRTVEKAEKSKEGYIKKYGDDSASDYKLGFEKIDCLDFIDVNNVVLSDKNSEFDEKALIVGNIRMGFGHYRISIAMASCARALGYTPYWLDLAGLDTTGSKMIREKNELYSKGSRISQKSGLFNKLVWEPMNKDGFKKLTYNAVDQKNSELFVPIFSHIPKDIPYIATHVWPAQGAIHAGMKNVVNAIPDNWPMALHLSEGAIHTVQTPFSYLGYKMLNGFAKEKLSPMKSNDIRMVGHYVDHEIVSNLEKDNAKRRNRINGKEPLRLLLTVGGAGAGQDMFCSMITHLMPYVKEKKVALFINFGDHLNVYNYLRERIDGFDGSKNYFNKYNELKEEADRVYLQSADGIYCVYNENIFEAVYSTNLLMRVCDCLITKPSELVFYPIPKVFMKHIGGHEAYGAIHGAEIGDATFECDTADKINDMLDTIINDKDVILEMLDRIEQLKQSKCYDGAYECVRLASSEK